MTTLSTAFRFASAALVALGIAALAFAGVAAAYPGLYQQYQAQKFEQIVDATRFAPTPIGPHASTMGELREGIPVGRLDIPRLGISVVVLHGVDQKTLILGVGHVPGTPLPGADGNIALAGHRDTFFRPLKDIEPGDILTFSTLSGAYDYVVEFTEVVGPADTYVLESRGHDELTLITCYPFSFFGAAPERFIVHARPQRSSREANDSQRGWPPSHQARVGSRQFP